MSSSFRSREGVSSTLTSTVLDLLSYSGSDEEGSIRGGRDGGDGDWGISLRMMLSSF